METKSTIYDLDNVLGTNLCSYILGHYSGGCHINFTDAEIKYGSSPKRIHGHYKYSGPNDMSDNIHVSSYRLSLKKNYSINEFGLWSDKMVEFNDNSNKNTTLCRLVMIDPAYNKYVNIHFLKGCFDQNGEICLDDNDGYPICKLYVHNDNFVDIIKSILDNMTPKIPYEIITENRCIKWYGINAVDILDVLYRDPNCIYNDYLYERYISILNYHVDRVPLFRYMLTIENAHKPEKLRESDAAYDLWLEKKIKTINGISFYDTGVAIKPEHGYYCELVGRSSIAKSGYMLANNIGIIDANYNGNIIVALFKTNPDVQELELPIKLVQLLPRKHISIQMQQVDSLDRTSRNDDGGLGSKNIK